MDAAQKTKVAFTSTELGEEVILKDDFSKNCKKNNISILDMLHTILGVESKTLCSQNTKRKPVVASQVLCQIDE